MVVGCLCRCVNLCWRRCSVVWWVILILTQNVSVVIVQKCANKPSNNVSIQYNYVIFKTLILNGESKLSTFTSWLKLG